MTMIEKVARAIDPHVWFILDGNDMWRKIHIHGAKLESLNRARAAIAAMREPTPDMVKAGVDMALSTAIGGDYKWPDYVADKHRAMIDAALKEDAP